MDMTISPSSLSALPLSISSLSFSGKLRTSVALSTPRYSRFSSCIRSLSTMVTEISAG